MVQKTVAQHPSKSRRIIEILVLLAIIAGIILVLAELVTNVLPEVRGRPSIAPQASQVQHETASGNNAAGLHKQRVSEMHSTRS